MIFGLVPVTNPVATAYFKTLVGLKSRNAVILSFHHAVLGVGNRVGELIQRGPRRRKALLPTWCSGSRSGGVASSPSSS